MVFIHRLHCHSEQLYIYRSLHGIPLVYLLLISSQFVKMNCSATERPSGVETK